MVKLDELLSIIENPARRRILEALAREPHYPLQLSRELGISQQAVMKHLKVLEQYKLVRSYHEKSDLGGPRRRQFYPALNFTIVVDASPNMFTTEVHYREENRVFIPKNREIEDLSTNNRILELRREIAGIEEKLDDLYRQREALILDKESVLEEARSLAENLDDYQLRRILYEFISRPELDLKGIAKALDMRDEVVANALDEWLNWGR
ncbi:MAG: helix-turn-helix domain-containing protein [Euryarchaeota archaeon]|nr:helix-turn-helix domain-containing protein [Euryarchaeota archaeon]